MLLHTLRRPRGGRQTRRETDGGEEGFTLIEILVASAVLALLVALLASTFSHFAGVTSTSGKRLETSNQIRTVFDRMAFDLRSSVRNAGMTISFLKNKQATGGTTTVNDAISFLVDARTTSPQSRFARVGYEVSDETFSPDGTPPTSLMRCLEPFYWTDNAATPALTSNADRQVFGRGVFRFELSFIRTDGGIVADPPASSSDISAVVCTTASLDESTFAKLTEAQRSQLVNAFPDSVNGSLPLSAWAHTSLSGLPIPVTQHVRFNQRVFKLQ